MGPALSIPLMAVPSLSTVSFLSAEAYFNGPLLSLSSCFPLEQLVAERQHVRRSAVLVASSRAGRIGVLYSS